MDWVVISITHFCTSHCDKSASDDRYIERGKRDRQTDRDRQRQTETDRDRQKDESIELIGHSILLVYFAKENNMQFFNALYQDFVFTPSRISVVLNKTHAQGRISSSTRTTMKGDLFREARQT